MSAPYPILVINCGSSSLKFSVLEPETEALLASGIAERLVTAGAVLKMVDLEGGRHRELMPGADHRAALLRIIELLGSGQKLEIKAIGHRIVHGGEDFRGPVLVCLQAAERLGKPIEETQFISAHLGNGCSATALRHGQSMDTSMGLTPQEGLVMGTRSGDVDPNLHLFLQEKEDHRLKEITEMLTRKSGLLGVSGVSHDMRSVIAAATEGNKRARLASFLLPIGALSSWTGSRSHFNRCFNFHRRHRGE